MQNAPFKGHGGLQHDGHNMVPILRHPFLPLGWLRAARMLVMERDPQVDSCFDWRNHIAS
jgi:hypothetical protein